MTERCLLEDCGDELRPWAFMTVSDTKAFDEGFCSYECWSEVVKATYR